MEIFRSSRRRSNRRGRRRDPGRRRPQQARRRSGPCHGRFTAAGVRGPRRPRAGHVRVRGFALDEYVGLPAGHPQSYAEVVRREVTERLHLDPANVFVPDGGAADPERAAADYDAAIARAAGSTCRSSGSATTGTWPSTNPGSPLDSRTRVEVLTERTRQANARYFDTPEEVPERCITQGLGTILEARQLLLVVNGADKAEILTAPWPVPFLPSARPLSLQLHPHVTVVADEARPPLLTARHGSAHGRTVRVASREPGRAGAAWLNARAAGARSLRPAVWGPVPGVRPGVRRGAGRICPRAGRSQFEAAVHHDDVGAHARAEASRFRFPGPRIAGRDQRWRTHDGSAGLTPAAIVRRTTSSRVAVPPGEGAVALQGGHGPRDRTPRRGQVRSRRRAARWRPWSPSPAPCFRLPPVQRPSGPSRDRGGRRRR